jgi:acyl carrier protein
MSISSRTPEGQPGYCPVCGSAVCLLPCEPIFDAPCPSCGHLLLFLTVGEQTEILEFSQERQARIRRLLCERLGIEQQTFPDDAAETAKLINDLGADSLDAVELVMELEDDAED